MRWCDSSIRESVFIECDMARNNNTTGGGIEVSVAFVIVRSTKINTRERSWLKLMGGGGSDVWKT